MSTIYISVHPEETRMGVVEQDKLVDYVVERNSENHLVSSVFQGRVNNVVPGIQAAFIDIGHTQNAFLYVEPQVKLTQGQIVLVQVIKDARSTKGPAVTSDISLPGRYVVLQPFNPRLALSKKLSPKSLRHKIKAVAESHQPQGMGLVVRTAAANATEEELIADIERLVAAWHIILERSKRGKAPQLLYRELDLPVRMVRDYLTKDVHKIVVDDKSVGERVKSLLPDLAQEDVGVVYYQQKEDIFAYYGLEEAIAAISDRTVWLPCGGYLVFDYTEALTVIDVNSGRYKGQDNMAATIMEINKEAAAEIAHQLRLRDIGGIVVVDFIDMETSAAQEELLTVLRKHLSNDKMKPKVQDITALNLVEITRRKERQNLSTVLYAPCPVCQGSGRVQSPETVCVEIRRKLRTSLGVGHLSRDLEISVHPQVAQWCKEYAAKDMEREFHCHIHIVSDASMEPEAFAILAAGHEGS